MNEQLVAERRELQRQRAEAQASIEESKRGLRLLDVFRNARHNGKVLKDCTANENQILELANPGEEDQICGDWFNKIIQQTPSLVNRFVWTDPPVSKFDKKAEERDRAEFTAFVKQNRYGDNIANFNAARGLLGPGNVRGYQLAQAVQSNALRLSPASAQELEDREAERIREHNEKLQSMSTGELRKLSGEGFDARRAQAAQAVADHSFAQKEQHDQHMGYPELPEYFRGRKLDREFFIKYCDRTTMRFLNQKYGPANVEARIRGIR
jgi:hypothetical protein